MTSDEFDDKSKARSGYREDTDGTRKTITMQVFRGTEKLGELRLVADQETAEIKLGSTEPKRKR
jgi:hypothetical protein